jgi:ribosomal protein L12E/L44/L45/RPP1/RPP2
MNEPSKLEKLLLFCSQNKLEFNLERGENTENKIDINVEDKKINIIISDVDDKELNDLLENKIKELHNLFKD